MGMIVFTADVEVFPDGISSWIAKGSVTRDDSDAVATFNWFELSATSEDEAVQTAAHLMIERVTQASGALVNDPSSLN